MLIPKPVDPVGVLEKIGKLISDRSFKELRKEIEEAAMEDIE